MTRFSISLPEELSRQLRRIQREDHSRISHIVAEALREYVARHYVQSKGKERYESPIALSKLKATGRFSLRSPRLVQRRIRESWIVEEYGSVKLSAHDTFTRLSQLNC
jgi:hypothetical protein